MPQPTVVSSNSSQNSASLVGPVLSVPELVLPPARSVITRSQQEDILRGLSGTPPVLRSEEMRLLVLGISQNALASDLQGRMLEGIGRLDPSQRLNLAQQLGEGSLTGSSGGREQLGVWRAALTPVLIRSLDSAEFSERRQASDILSNYGRDAIPALQQALRNGNLETSRRAEGILDRIGPVVSSELASEFYQGSERVRRNVSETVGRLEGQDHPALRRIGERVRNEYRAHLLEHILDGLRSDNQAERDHATSAIRGLSPGVEPASFLLREGEAQANSHALRQASALIQGALVEYCDRNCPAQRRGEIQQMLDSVVWERPGFIGGQLRKFSGSLQSSDERTQSLTALRTRLSSNLGRFGRREFDRAVEGDTSMGGWNDHVIGNERE